MRTIDKSESKMQEIVTAASPRRPGDSKKRILAAGQRVFVAHPYGAAGVRKIENAGKISYALIRYYFGSKKGLFDAVAAESAREFTRFFTGLVKKTAGLDAEAMLLVWIEELVDFGFDHPEGPSLIMLNIGDPRYLAGTSLDGEKVGRHFYDLIRIFKTSMTTVGDEPEIAGRLFAFSIIIANLIGARGFHATSLGLSPDSTQYRQWVKSALTIVFTPVLAEIIDEDQADPEITVPDKARLLIGEVPVRPPADNEKMTKGDLTREKILEAAGAVFTRMPYHTASLRLIGRQGGFDFTIIHHYFPTKKDLAEAVSKRVYENFFHTSTYWWLAFTDRETTGPLYLSQAMSQYFDRLLDYYFARPEAPAILMQNIAQPEGIETLPVFEYSLMFFSNILERLKAVLPVASDEETIRMWQYCLVTFICNCVGAPAYPASIIKQWPKNKDYRKQVKESILGTFYPGLKHMLKAASK